jgi:hypothetical protein
VADLATSPFSTTLSDTLTIRTGLAGRRAVPRRLNVTHSQHAGSAQQIYSSTVSALAVFLAMNRPYSRPGDLHRVTTPIAEYGAEEGDCGRIATASLCAGVSVAGYAARTTPSTGVLDLVPALASRYSAASATSAIVTSRISPGLDLGGGRGRPADGQAVPVDQTVIRCRGWTMKA